MVRQYRLKEVSKAKLQILGKYFPAWARILGVRHRTLVYVDCFAGSGTYLSGEEGSPLVVLNKAQDIVKNSKNPFSLILIFVEKDEQSANQLRNHIPENLPAEIRVSVFNEDAQDLVPKLLKEQPCGRPAFFFVDPFGHPLTIPVINQVLSRPLTEVLLNLMWYAINMHLSNPKVQSSITRMFGNETWRSQSFMQETGWSREKHFAVFFWSR